MAAQRAKLVKLGFVHCFLRTIKRQHELVNRYIAKKVENLQLKNTYACEAEFRLNVLSLLLQDGQQDIHRIFVLAAFPKYLVDNMLASPTLLDLRFHKGSFDIVPFRFCNPLRAEAITLLSFLLPASTSPTTSPSLSPLNSEVVSRLIPTLAAEKNRLQQYEETA